MVPQTEMSCPSSRPVNNAASGESQDGPAKTETSRENRSAEGTRPLGSTLRVRSSMKADLSPVTCTSQERAEFRANQRSLMRIRTLAFTPDPCL